MNVVITGANRGIGLGLTSLCISQGHCVYASTRLLEESYELLALAKSNPALTVLPLDVCRPESCQAFASDLKGAPVDILFNNAGTGGPREGIESIDLREALSTIDTNAMGPLRVAQSIAPNLKHPGAKVINISSDMASISGNTTGTLYAYRMSKAAMNMASRTLAAEWRPIGVSVACIHPGLVQTRLGGDGAPFSVQEAASNLLRLAQGITLEQSGSFIDYAGQPMDW